MVPETRRHFHPTSRKSGTNGVTGSRERCSEAVAGERKAKDWSGRQVEFLEDLLKPGFRPQRVEERVDLAGDELDPVPRHHDVEPVQRPGVVALASMGVDQRELGNVTR